MTLTPILYSFNTYENARHRMNAPTAPVNPPNGEMTPAQRETLAEWFAALHDRYDRYDFAINFSLSIAGDKPATLLQGFDLTVEGGPFQSNDDALSYVHGLGFATKLLREERSWYCARNHPRLGLLPSSDSTEKGEDRQRIMGAFFGYPEADVEFFVHTPPEERVDARERAENGDFTPAELAYTSLVPYVHDTSMEGYVRAICAGMGIRNRINELSFYWDLPILDLMAGNHYELARDVYSGEREYFPGEYIGTKIICKNPELE